MILQEETDKTWFSRWLLQAFQDILPGNFMQECMQRPDKHFWIII